MRPVNRSVGVRQSLRNQPTSGRVRFSEGPFTLREDMRVCARPCTYPRVPLTALKGSFTADELN